MESFHVVELLNETIYNLTLRGERLGGIEYVRSNPYLCIPYMIIVCCTALFGTTGNVLLLAAIFYSKELRNPGNLLVVNLALADITVAAVANGLTLLGMLLGEVYFLDRPALCQFVAAVCLTACGCSWFTLPIVAINRFLKICHHQVYKKVFTRRNTVALCIAIWLFATLIQCVNFMKWGNYLFDKKALACIVDRQANLSFSFFFSVTYVFIPGGISAFCYIRISSFVRASKRRVDVATRAQTSQNQKGDFNLATTLCVIWIAYFLFWSPYSLLFISDYWDTLPQWPYLYSVAIGHANSAVNPFLYGTINKSFRKGYVKVLHLDRCWNPPNVGPSRTWHSSTQPQPNITEITAR